MYNVYDVAMGLLFKDKCFFIGGPTLLVSKKRASIAEEPRLRREMVAAISLKLLQHKILCSTRQIFQT